MRYTHDVESSQLTFRTNRRSHEKARGAFAARRLSVGAAPREATDQLGMTGSFTFERTALMYLLGQACLGCEFSHKPNAPRAGRLALFLMDMPLSSCVLRFESHGL
jgi:hypothetical protein